MDGYFFSELKRFLKERKITQVKMAQDLNASQPYVSAILNGKTPIGKAQAKRLSELYGSSVSWLLTGEGEMLSTEPRNSNNVQTNDGNNNNITITRARTYNNTEDTQTDDVKPIVPKYLAEKQDTDVYEVIKHGQISNLTTMKVIPPYVDFDFYYQVRQDAMTPDYKQGDVLALKHLKGDDNDIIQGAAMVIDTTDYGFLLRRLYDRGDYYECKRINEASAFENQNVSKDKVIRLYRVVYSVRLGD